jgi:hypothetical protein
LCIQKIGVHLSNKTTAAMTIEQFTQTAKVNMSKISTSDLMLEVKKLSNDFSDSATMVFDIALDILMDRLPESEFVNFCNNL